MARHSTDQRESHLADGAIQSGRDTIISNYRNAARTDIDAIKNQIELLDLAVRDYSGASRFARELQGYVEPQEGLSGKDLATKLAESERDHIIEKAELYKELFRKRITELQFSHQAQQIFGNMLGGIVAKWDHLVLPLIHEGKSKAEIDKVIYEEIISSFGDLIGIEPLRLSHPDIQGMIYFLTGNCWLEWS